MKFTIYTANCTGNEKIPCIQTRGSLPVRETSRNLLPLTMYVQSTKTTTVAIQILLYLMLSRWTATMTTAKILMNGLRLNF